MSTKVYIKPNIPQQFAVSQSVSDQAIGVVLPFGKSNSGIYFKQSYTTIDQAKSNIQNLILTMIGERIMHPSLGSGIWNIIFEPMATSDELSIQLDSLIRESIAQWLPYISIDSLTVTSDDANNAVNIAMTISLKNDPQTKSTMELSISKGDI